LGAALAQNKALLKGVTMAIPIICACGKNFHVNDELAGKRIKCPACNAVLLVPLVAPEVFTLADPEPEPIRPGTRRSRQELAEEDDDEPRETHRERRKKRQGVRGFLDVLLFLGTGLLLATCCLGSGIGVWLYFFNFTGSELVGTWETDPPASKDRYGMLRFNRFGDITVMPPGKPVSAKGNWRVLSKKDSTFVVEITNSDGSGKIEAEITMLTRDRIRVVLSQPAGAFELRRVD
jgi:hypothetical protein